MPRIRTIKPEFFGSPDTAKASFKARLLYIAMWCWADDYGVGLTNLQSLAGFAFEHDDTSASEVQSLLSEVQGSFGVVFYTVGGRYYYAIPSWDDHQKTQRKAARRNPGPDHPEACPDQRFNDLQGTSEWTQGTSVHPQGDVDPGKGKGTGEKEQGKGNSAQARSDYSPEFDTFWATYPRKEAKRQAWKAWGKAIERATPEQITAGARRYADDPNRSEQFTKHGATWLNADGWEDEPLPSASGRGNTHDAWSTPKGYDPADWLRPSNEPAFDYIDAEVVQLREIGR